MELYIKVKTKNGVERKAKLSRYFNASYNRFMYAIKFYSDFHSFTHHSELRRYVLENYNVDIGERKDFWGL